MLDKNLFIAQIVEGYSVKGEQILLGAAMLNGEPIPKAQINLPLKTFNRHGLIAGATGTGKTKTIQVLSEQLSLKGVPVLMMDLKGDFSGIAKAGQELPFITERHSLLQIPFKPVGYPVELMSLSPQQGVRLRSTVSEFGPVLFSRILSLNDVQSGIVAVLFKYCDDNNIPLLDLKDVKKVIHYLTNDGKSEIEEAYGKLSTSSAGTILRKIVELEQQGGALFFGEKSFEITDLMRFDEDGRAYINIIRLTDIQDKPKLFSTFMLSLLAEIYQQMPERGDLPQPELVVFIDEAHLVFNEASPALLDQIESIIKLIRSKGIGVFFITQNPMDVPPGILAQLGMKIQHALRAFTANDRKAIKMTADNYPISEYYKTDIALTSLGIGEALVTALNEKGIPTPLAATMVRAPSSRMDILSDHEIAEINKHSALAKKYNEEIDRDSAYEILSRKIPPRQHDTETTMPKTPAAEPLGPAAKSVIKVLTSASFIRGAFGVLNKILKK